MNRLKPALVCYLLPALVVVGMTAAYARTQDDQNTLCNHEYALCTSARCIPAPGEPDKTICFCDVEKGKNMSTVPCDQLKPSTDKNGVRTVYSTFSLEQAIAGKKAMKCPGGTPWSWCLNKKCTVDPSDPTKAICICDVVRTDKEWMTFGGDCDTSTCQTAYWSGAYLADVDSANAFMTKALGLDESPMKWCPASK